MINGNVIYFYEKLFLLEELEIGFHGKRYFIQGYGKPDAPDEIACHIEMFELDAEGNSIGCNFEFDGPSPDACVEAFLSASLWSDHTFREMESEIEWLA